MEHFVWENITETKKQFVNSFFITENGCWLWKRSLNWKQGNRFDSFYHRGQKRRVNVVAYELFNDVILPNSYKGRAVCNTPNCIHPHHTALYQNGSKTHTPPVVLALFQQGVPDRPELTDEQWLQLNV